MATRRTLTWLFPLGLVFCIVTAVSSDEIGRYLTDDYDEECPASNNVENRSMTHDWKEELVAHSGWTSNNEYDYELTNRKLSDPDKYADAQDYNYIESIDIVLLGGHGGDYNDGGTWVYRYLKENMYYDVDCFVYPHEDMDLGELSTDDIEILHLVSCNSLEKDNNQYRNTWRPVMHGIHQINGFHGITWSSDDLDDDYYRVARDGYGNDAVSAEWIVELYEGDFHSHDICPTSYAAGNLSQSASTVLNNEKYNYRSFTDITSPITYAYRYLDNCDPDSGDPM